MREGIKTTELLTLVTRGRFLGVGVKNSTSNGVICDVSPKSDRASPNMKSPSGTVHS